MVDTTAAAATVDTTGVAEEFVGSAESDGDRSLSDGSLEVGVGAGVPVDVGLGAKIGNLGLSGSEAALSITSIGVVFTENVSILSHEFVGISWPATIATTVGAVAINEMLLREMVEWAINNSVP